MSFSHFRNALIMLWLSRTHTWKYLSTAIFSQNCLQLFTISFDVYFMFCKKEVITQYISSVYTSSLVASNDHSCDHRTLLHTSISLDRHTWKMSEILLEEDCSFPDFSRKFWNYVNSKIATKQRNLSANTMFTTFTSYNHVYLIITKK